MCVNCEIALDFLSQSDNIISYMKTKVFSHKGIVGISSSFEAPGLVNNPTDGKTIGFMVKASEIEMSQDALDSLKLLKRSESPTAEVDVFVSPIHGVVFCWAGGAIAMIDPYHSLGAVTFDPSLLDKAVTIVENNPPFEFVRAVDRIVGVLDGTKILKPREPDGVRY